MKDFSIHVPKWGNGYVFPYHREDDLTNFRIREMDYLETSAATGLSSPDAILQHSIDNSIYVWTIKAENKIHGIFGVTPAVGWISAGVPWLIGAETLPDIIRPVEYTRIARNIIEAFHQKWFLLLNYVMADYSDAIIWLETLGFSVKYKTPVKLSDKEFYLFIKGA